MPDTRIFRSMFFSLAILPAACGYPTFDIDTAKHVLTIDEYGRLLDTRLFDAPPTIPKQASAVRPDKDASWSSTEDLIDVMLNGIVEGTEPRPEAGDRRRRVMIFAHGGLNSWNASSDTIHELMGKMQWKQSDSGEPPPDPYPIFIQWNSEAFHCLQEHFWWIRQGRFRDRLWPLAGPLFFIGDLGRGIVTLPVTWLTEIENTWNTAPSMKRNATARYAHYSLDPVDDQRLGRGDDPDRSWWTASVEETGNFLYLPLRSATMPLVNGFGEPAWENMLRRTRMLFHTEEEFEANDGKLSDGFGAMAIFLRKLQTMVDEHGGPDNWDILLVGHSMGAIVCSDALRMSPKLPVRDIVFMGAACSLREYRDSVIPFLKMTDHADTQMHHLTLSDWAEEHEAYFSPAFELAPRGSLLVWIDSFLSSPATLLDRTAGRYANLMATMHLDDELPDGLRSRITVRQFGSGPKAVPNSPQGHGEFIDKVRFWRRETWQPIEK